MAHTKSGGSTKLGRDSRSKRLGLKLHDGQTARAGQIIIRQRGSKYHAGLNVRRGADDTLYAGVEGVVKFSERIKNNFDGSRRKITSVAVRPA